MRLGKPPGVLNRLCCIAVLLATGPVLWGDDWPQWLGPRRDAVWRETGILAKFPADGLTIRWRTPIKAGFSGPAVTGGRVYVMDRLRASAEGGGANPPEPGSASSRERILCLREADGSVVWQQEYDCAYTISYGSGPRTTPTVSEGKVYTLGAQGHLCCLDAATGKVIWTHDFKKEFKAATPIWGFAGHPLVDGNKVICIVGGEECLAMAFDKETGRELWRALNAREPGYSAPVIYEAGGRRQLIIWHPEALNSLDPETGRVYWSEPFASRTGLSVATPRQMGDLLFVTAFYDGPLMMKLASDQPTATVLWRGRSHSEMKTDGLHSIIPTPFLEEGHIYGVCSYGQLRCLRADTGERVWSTLKATTSDEKETRWANTFLVKNGNRFFLANEKGDLIIARLTPQGYDEVSRVHLLEPTNRDPGRAVVWSHPAFANHCIYARNDKEIVCASLAEQ